MRKTPLVVLIVGGMEKGVILLNDVTSMVRSADPFIGGWPISMATSVMLMIGDSPKSVCWRVSSPVAELIENKMAWGEGEME